MKVPDVRVKIFGMSMFALGGFALKCIVEDQWLLFLIAITGATVLGHTYETVWGR